MNPISALNNPYGFDVIKQIDQTKSLEMNPISELNNP